MVSKVFKSIHARHLWNKICRRMNISSFQKFSRDRIPSSIFTILFDILVLGKLLPVANLLYKGHNFDQILY